MWIAFTNYARNTGINMYEKQELAFHEALGQRVRDLRKAKKMSQEELGEAVRLSRSQISYIEIGKSSFKMSVIPAMVRILDTTYEYLLEGNDAASRPISEPQAEYRTRKKSKKPQADDPDLLDCQRRYALLEAENQGLLKAINEIGKSLKKE
jgi:transcriptional regulator with XRE-family HTH domain